MAALAERLGGMVRALWKDGSWFKGFGARELLQLLSHVQDATGQLKIEAGEPPRGWLKLRLR